MTKLPLTRKDEPSVCSNVAGIGFTASLFITGLVFEGDERRGKDQHAFSRRSLQAVGIRIIEKGAHLVM